MHSGLCKPTQAGSPQSQSQVPQGPRAATEGVRFGKGAPCGSTVQGWGVRLLCGPPEAGKRYRSLHLPGPQIRGCQRRRGLHGRRTLLVQRRPRPSRDAIYALSPGRLSQRRSAAHGTWRRLHGAYSRQGVTARCGRSPLPERIGGCFRWPDPGFLAAQLLL